jgi:AcrR family transcriptional regulator
MNTAASLQHSRATIMAELATVLRDGDTGTTNIESAIARTSVSMQEIAASFGGKRELLLAMVSQLSDSMSAPLTAGSATPDLRQRLMDFGQGVTNTYANSHLRGLYRIAITESIRHTGLAREFHEAGPGRLTQRLADFLQIAQAGGVLRRADPHLLASHFLSLLRANLDIPDTFPRDLATRPIGREYVRNAVDLFCRGIDGGRQPC